MKHIQKYLELRVASAGAVTETASCAEEKTDDAASFVLLWEAGTSADVDRSGEGSLAGGGGSGRGGKKKSDPLRKFC